MVVGGGTSVSDVVCNASQIVQGLSNMGTLASTFNIIKCFRCDTWSKIVII